MSENDEAKVLLLLTGVQRHSRIPVFTRHSQVEWMTLQEFRDKREVGGVAFSKVYDAATAARLDNECFAAYQQLIFEQR